MPTEDVGTVVVQVSALLSRERADVHIRMDAPCVDQTIARLRNDKQPLSRRERQVAPIEEMVDVGR